MFDMYSHNRTLVYDPSRPAPQKDRVRVDYCQSQEVFVGAHFIMECSKKLNVDCIVTATACCLFHKFWRNKPAVNVYDQYLIAAACMYVAGKLEAPDQLKIRDLVNVGYHTLRGNKSEPLSLDTDYYNLRDSICQAELLVLRFVGYRVGQSHPHPYLLHYLRSLKHWISPDVWEKYPIAKTSWSILQDAFLDPSILDQDPSCLSVGCIALAMQAFGIEIPYLTSKSQSWYQIFSDSISREKKNEAMAFLMNVYYKETLLIDPLLIPLEGNV